MSLIFTDSQRSIYCWFHKHSTERDFSHPHQKLTNGTNYGTDSFTSTEVRHWTLNSPENVKFTVEIGDIRGAYAAGDVFLFPAKDDQGIAVLEAMACGKVCVLSNIPVFREYYEARLGKIV